jgi:acyl-CoA dehydrogenase
MQGYFSPNFKPTHVAFRAKVRKFVEEELKPNLDQWIEEGATYPNELHIKAYAAGINGAIFPAEYGGTPPEDYDAFHEVGR